MSSIEEMRGSIRREVHAIHGLRDVHRALVDVKSLLHLIAMLAESDAEIGELANVCADGLAIVGDGLSAIGAVYHARALAERPASDVSDGA